MTWCAPCHSERSEESLAGIAGALLLVFLPGACHSERSEESTPALYKKRPSMTIATPSIYKIDTIPVQELLETVSLYLHIPFCHTRCYYCDFNTYAGLLSLREPYVRALLTEIELAGEMARTAAGAPRRARTIYSGGGTPSLLSAEQIRRLLDACRAAFAVDPEVEISLEAN